MIGSLVLIALAASSPNIKTEFQKPPNSAKPHTWWHWMDGNITKEGITADLEAMKEVGIGGAQLFHISQNIPAGPVGYNSEIWRKMIGHAVKEADRLGIELCIHNCAGWSSSGGPWITPENAMQVLAWSETKVTGPTKFNGVLPKIKAPQIRSVVNYSKDIVVYAYPTPENEVKRPGDFLGRTGVNRQDGLDPVSGSDTGVTIPKKDLIVLTGALDKDGRLTWDVPAGNWTILRLGHVPTGKDNHPAPPEGNGLEVDKLSKEALDTHWNGMMAKVIAEVGPLAGKVLNNSLIDSYEVGGQNWTPKFRQEFQRLRGYDPLPYMPAVTGIQIESKEITDRFLWDFRRTIADLFTENYYGHFAKLCHKAGMLFSTEPYGDGNLDNIQSGGTADIVMGEFWLGGAAMETTKLASSVGHVYGMKYVGAESFTASEGAGKWLEEPYAAKTIGDLVFTNGVNRYIFHRYAHQPWMKFKPGMTMGPWGTHLERTQTWWTEAGEWMKYISRCQSLLQEGKFVADVLYYYGEDAPLDLPYRPNLRPSIPNGYDYDGCDATILFRAKVLNGRIVLPDGMSYRVLVLPEKTTMTPRIVERIRTLVEAGATVVGPKPVQTPGLANFPSSDVALRKAADAVWGPSSAVAGSNKFGKGRIYWNTPLSEIFEDLNLKQDFSFRALTGRGRLVNIHRTINGADVYFVSNQEYRNASVEMTFRVAGKVPEFWHADTGKTETAPLYKINGDTTTVPMNFGPAESVFVVFKDAAKGTSFSAITPEKDPNLDVKIPRVRILSARYQTADGRGVDVADKIMDLINQGENEVTASNANFGDPVFNTVKRLDVTYEMNGKVIKKSVDENATLTFYQLPAIPSGGYDLQREGRTWTLSAWRKGRFHLESPEGVLVRVDAPAPDSLAVNGSWTVKFDPKWGGPASTKFDSLISWPDSADKGIKYYSGSAFYHKTIQVPKTMIGKGRMIKLDLGRVKNFATVKINGKDAGVLWKEPFVVDVSNLVKAGANNLEVKITNLWPNRIIGDEQLPPDVEWNGVVLTKWPEWLVKGQPRPNTGRYTFTTWKYWNKDSTLLESGLIGPVQILSAKPQTIIMK